MWWCGVLTNERLHIVETATTHINSHFVSRDSRLPCLVRFLPQDALAISSTQEKRGAAMLSQDQSFWQTQSGAAFATRASAKQAPTSKFSQRQAMVFF